MRGVLLGVGIVSLSVWLVGVGGFHLRVAGF